MSPCPDCPECGHPPRFIIGVQAFCGTEGCIALSWNVNRTRAENVAHANEITIENGDDA
jgi:hypothetical protein